MKIIPFSFAKPLALLFSIFFLLSCGGGSDDSSTSSSAAPATNTAPAISNLRFSPSSAVVGQGGGAITVSGQIDFADDDGDVKTLSLVTPEDSSLLELENTKGLRVGTISVILIAVDTTSAGVFPFNVAVLDSAGNGSNILTGTFIVR